MFKKENIIKELEKGEKSGFVKNFNRNSFIKEMDLKHSQKNCKTRIQILKLFPKIV